MAIRTYSSEGRHSPEVFESDGRASPATEFATNLAQNPDLVHNVGALRTIFKKFEEDIKTSLADEYDTEIEAAFSKGKNLLQRDLEATRQEADEAYDTGYNKGLTEGSTQAREQCCKTHPRIIEDATIKRQKAMTSISTQTDQSTAHQSVQTDLSGEMAFTPVVPTKKPVTTVSQGMQTETDSISVTVIKDLTTTQAKTSRSAESALRMLSVFAVGALTTAVWCVIRS